MYVRGRLTQEKRRGVFIACYSICLMSAVLAMKTKEIAFTLPIIIVIYEFMFFSGYIKKRILYLIPLLITIFIIPYTLIGAEKPIGELIGDVSEATKLQTAMSRWEYLFTEIRVIVTYIRLLFLPTDQNLDYDYPVYHTFFTPEVLLSFLFLFLMVIAGLYAHNRYKNNQPYTSIIVFGIAWFFLTLSVESSVIPIVDVIFEHRVYLPSIGFFLALITSVYIGIKKFTEKWRGDKRLVIVICLTIVIVFSGLTFMRNKVWTDTILLWKDVVSKSPYKSRGYYNLGNAYKEVDLNIAQEFWEKALAIDPELSMASNQIGNVYFLSYSFKQAKKYYNNAVQADYNNAEAHYNLARTLELLNEAEMAVLHYEIFLSIAPSEYSSLFPGVKKKLSQFLREEKTQSQTSEKSKNIK
jgi:hypothetical protein